VDRVRAHSQLAELVLNPRTVSNTAHRAASILANLVTPTVTDDGVVARPAFTFRDMNVILSVWPLQSHARPIATRDGGRRSRPAP